MTLLRLLNFQGIAGLLVSVALGVFLAVQTVESRHWKNQSGKFEQLYTQEQSALAATTANYRSAALQAEASDKANADRAAAAQRAINERTDNDYQARLAAAHSLAQRLRQQSAGASADSGGRPGAPVPGLSASSGGPAQGPGQDGLSQSDALTATDQAIQLDELIKWVRAQAAVDANGATGVESVPGRR